MGFPYRKTKCFILSSPLSPMHLLLMPEDRNIRLEFGCKSRQGFTGWMLSLLIFVNPIVNVRFLVSPSFRDPRH